MVAGGDKGVREVISKTITYFKRQNKDRGLDGIQNIK